MWRRVCGEGCPKKGVQRGVYGEGCLEIDVRDGGAECGVWRGVCEEGCTKRGVRKGVWI